MGICGTGSTIRSQKSKSVAFLISNMADLNTKWLLPVCKHAWETYNMGICGTSLKSRRRKYESGAILMSNNGDTQSKMATSGL